MAERMVVETWRDPVDAVVVGMGPGGEEAAGRLADAGLDVVGVDGWLLGGECPYYGCIPSKTLVRAADLLAEAWRVPGTAGTVMVEPSFAPVARHVREATADWNDRAAVERFTGRGGTFLRGYGRITAPGEVTVLLDEEEREVVLRPRRAIVVATGGRPAVPPVPGLAGTPFWTSREAVAATEAPRSLAVLGGGPVGLELAQSFARFGTDVTVFEAAPRLLPEEEPEAGELLLRVLTEQGLAIRAGTAAQGVGHDGTAFTVDGDRGDRVVAERLLVATGRWVDVTATGISALGLPRLEQDLDAVPVDDRMRVVPPVGARPGVWAVGDATGRGAYTHQALAQADVAVRGILGEGGPPAAVHAVPRVTFTDPEVGAVGLTEAEAAARGVRVRTAVADLGSGARGALHGPGGAGFVKLVADDAAGVLVGASSAGPSGGEVLGALTLAVHARVPVAELARTTWAFPTFHRAVGAALRAL